MLAIKHGELSYAAVGEEIETLLEAVEAAAVNCGLPEAPEPGLAEDFIADLYGRIVRGEVS